MGRLTRDPELKSLPSGTYVCTFSMATNRVWKNEKGEKQEAVEYHNIVAFGRQAELIAQYIGKGYLFFIEGRNQTRSWEDKETGKSMYRTEIVVENMQFAPRSTNSNSRSGGESDLDREFPDGAPQAPKSTARKYPAKTNKKVERAPQGEIEYPEEDINPEDIPF